MDCAQALENLAVSKLGKEKLREYPDVIDTLRALETDGMSDTARQSASRALFELDEMTRQKTKKATVARGGDGSEVVEHVMISYNWSHQEMIKRINLALQRRKYRVWIDIEKMQGSTLEAMSAAVEEAAVVVLAISKAYKESANCRLEAQVRYVGQSRL